METVQSLFMILLLAMAQPAFANQYSDDAAAEWSVDFVESMLVDNELICDRLNIRADFYMAKDMCIPIEPNSMRPIQRTSTDPTIQGILDAQSHNYEWDWATNKMLNKQRELDFQVNHYQEMRNALELAEDDFDLDSKFTNEQGLSCNPNGDVSSEFALNQSKQLFESMTLANQLHHTRKNLQARKGLQCSNPHARRRHRDTVPNCEDIAELIEEVTQGLQSLYVAHPVLTTDPVLDADSAYKGPLCQA